MRLRYSKASTRRQRMRTGEGKGIVGFRSSLYLCDRGKILPLYTIIFSPMKPQDWVLGSFWKEDVEMSCYGKLLFGKIAGVSPWGGWICGLWLSLLGFDVFESSWRKNRKLCFLCKQLIMLSISTLLPYNGDRNLIIQTHANVTILVFTYSLLITMPLTLCNLLCELGHIKHIVLITTSHGTTEDRTRIIGVWKETCWGLHCCKAKTGCQTQWLWLAL